MLLVRAVCCRQLSYNSIAGTMPASLSALTALVAQVNNDVAGASDGARVRMMADAIRDLAAATK